MPTWIRKQLKTKFMFYQGGFTFLNKLFQRYFELPKSDNLESAFGKYYVYKSNAQQLMHCNILNYNRGLVSPLGRFNLSTMHPLGISLMRINSGCQETKWLKFTDVQIHQSLFCTCTHTVCILRYSGNNCHRQGPNFIKLF